MTQTHTPQFHSLFFTWENMFETLKLGVGGQMLEQSNERQERLEEFN